ncbi:MAG: alpha-amylase [Bacteroidales bacterium]|nr:alpha-amylase [Bacteroidales bacterium]
MKKQAAFLLALAVAALGFVLSCDPTVDPAVSETLTVTPDAVSFEADDASVKFVYVTAEGDWTASLSGNWMHLEKSSGSGKGVLALTVDANAGEDRTGSLTVKAGSRTAAVSVSQKGRNVVDIVPVADAFDGTKRASTTYQLLIYSFADSDGDGVGDFKGIQGKLDYLDGLGVTALWLSPAHPSDSYHAYDVTDYYTVNPLYGTEQDFKDLIDAAHAKGIKIYMDYVLNHSGKGNDWFRQALSDPSSKYRDYYFITSNPSADYSKFPMLKGTTYQSGEWKQATSGSPKLTVTRTDEPVTTGTSDWNLWVWQDGGEGKVVRFTPKGDGTYYLVMEVNGKWGMLVRKYMNWNAGSKFGASGNGLITEGRAVDLVGEGNDMSFTGSGRYKIELTDVATETLYYMGCFSDWMPDLNYGDPATAETNPTFLDLAASADKWINLGIDGLRLDAVKHICGGINSYNNSSNQTLLKKWYDHCNATYKAAGHTDDIFIVAEAWDSHNVEKTYYKGINSCFEFEYLGTLSRAVNGNASNYVSTVNGYLSDHAGQRADAITSLFMSNHDQDRAAESFGRDAAKEKQAAAMLLTTPGKPFVYQGEELGYYGNKGNGDEYVRTPILWDKALKECAKKGVNNKVDNTMLKADISVEAQLASASSLLNVYKTWSRVRNTYPALADGKMTDAALGGGSSIGAWYMTSADGQKMLVIHNVASSEKSVTVKDDLSRPVALLGSATRDHDSLTLGAHSSVVFLL